MKDIITKKDLKIYLEKHNSVKNSLVGTVIEECEKLYVTPYKTAKLIYNYDFFGKTEMVIKVCKKKKKKNIIDELIELGIRNFNIQLLGLIKSQLSDIEQELSKRLFDKNIPVYALFDCLIFFDNTSKIYSKAIHILENKKYPEDEMITLLNSLTYLIYRESSVKLEFLRDQFVYIIFNSVYYSARKQDKELVSLRIKLLNRAIRRMKNNWTLIILSDFITAKELKVIKEDLEPNLLHWFQLEINLRELIPPTELLLMEELFPDTKFDIIWKKFKEAENSNDFFLFFELLKLKIFLSQKSIMYEDDLDYKKLLNNKLNAYYIKSLHDSGFISKVPFMEDIFKWPKLGEVKNYIKNFNSDFKDISPLSYIGYSVSKSSGLRKETRRSKLKEAFLQRDFVQFDWGEKGSPLRLMSIANHITRQIRLKRSTFQDNSEAIKKWKEDLNFLKVNFYDGNVADKFIWPKI